MPKGAISRVELRDVNVADLPAFFRIQSDPDANRMVVATPRDAAEFDAQWARILSDPTIIAKAILADEVLVGHITCHKMDGRDFVGYWIAKEHWNRGIATAALALLLKQVVIRPLHARVARSNAASIRTLEKCGFTITSGQTFPASDHFPECERVILTLI